MGVFYTDGSAHPNPGPGGYGVLEIVNDKPFYAYSKQTDEQTTNNREELKSILFVMFTNGRQISDFRAIPDVFSDSAYCVNTLNDWMFKWANNGWVKSDGKEPENLDLIKAYYEYYQDGYRINLQKIKGHNGHEWNELVDKLATGKITPKEVMELGYK